MVRPGTLPKVAITHSRHLNPAANQDTISSTTKAKTSSIVWTRRLKVLLFLSFQIIQQDSSTKESKPCRSSFWMRFLAASHHSASVWACMVRATSTQPNLRSSLNQTSLEKGHVTSRWSIVSVDWEHNAQVSSSSKPCRFRRYAVQHLSCNTSQRKNLHLIKGSFFFAVLLREYAFCSLCVRVSVWLPTQKTRTFCNLVAVMVMKSGLSPRFG